MSLTHIKVRSQNSFHLDVTREIASLEGHLFALPIIFINFGGEMIYVIEHRLKAQKLEDRMDKVMQDVIGTIFRPRIIDELFKPQHLLSESSMRTLFQKLAHASIMSLNQESMDKLLDLMTMTVKYQIFACKPPTDLIYCTLNHLDYMRNLVQHSETISNSLRKVYHHIERAYGRMDSQNLFLLRSTILRFFQDRKTRLSVFLQNGIQREADGVMRIPKDGEIPARSQINIPGKITYYKTTKGILSKEIVERRSENFQQGGNFKLVGSSSFEPSTAFDAPAGSRGTLLGTNLFANYKGPTIASIENASAPGTPKSRTNSDVGHTVNVTAHARRNAAAGAEMAMLARILGAIPDSKTSADEKTTIDLDFLSPDLNSSSGPSVKSVVNPTKVQRIELQKTKLKDFDLGLEASTKKEDIADDFDLLELMDQAAKNS